MSNYSHNNTNDRTADSITHEDQLLISSTAPPIWPSSQNCGTLTSTKLGSYSPTTPGTYYATINSTYSKRYLSFIHLLIQFK